MQQPSSSSSSPRRAALYMRTGAFYEMADSDVEPLHAYAAQHGYQIVETYHDVGKSGRDLKRPALTQLRADAAKRRFDVVLVAHRSRLAATEVDAHAVMDELRSHGVQVESLADDINQ